MIKQENNHGKKMLGLTNSSKKIVYFLEQIISSLYPDELVIDHNMHGQQMSSSRQEVLDAAQRLQLQRREMERAYQSSEAQVWLREWHKHRSEKQ